jgi:maleylpyruvate isomerase
MTASSAPLHDFLPDLAAVDRYTERLLATARSLDPGTLGAPSRCAGWTRGHVLTHISRNADALVNLVRNATTGSTTPMYASAEARVADIEAGAGRHLPEQVADLETSADRFRTAAAQLTPEVADVRLAARNNTSVRARFLPSMRLREVVIHHVDLDAGFTFADVDDDVVRQLLEDAVRRLRAHPEAPSLTLRTEEGVSWSLGEGGPTVSGSRVAVLGWLTRGLTEGVEGDLPALPFGG